MDPLLKRPFGYFRMDAAKGELEILYRVRGRVTSLMSALQKGGEVEMLGPLGNPYPELISSKTPLIAAGGVGIASVYPLLERFKGRAHLFYGGKNRDELPLKETIEKKRLARRLVISTEDGSAGLKGTLVEALEVFLKEQKFPAKSFTLFACGPQGMLKALSRLGLDGYVSVEEKMACGIGVCLGCAVKTKNGYKRACAEGPVFNIKEVAFE